MLIFLQRREKLLLAWGEVHTWHYLCIKEDALAIPCPGIAGYDIEACAIVQAICDAA